MSETVQYKEIIDVVHKESFFGTFAHPLSDKGSKIVAILDTYYRLWRKEGKPEAEIYDGMDVTLPDGVILIKGFNHGDFERGIEFLRRNYSVYYVPLTIRKQHEDSLKKKNDEITSFLNAVVQYKKTIRDLEVKLNKEHINPYDNPEAQDQLSFEKHYTIGTLEDVFEIYLYLDELVQYINQEQDELLGVCKCSDSRHEIEISVDRRLTKILERRQFLYDLLLRNGYFDQESAYNE